MATCRCEYTNDEASYGFDALNGGDGDSSTYVPQFEAFLKHAQLATHLPLDQVIVLGDRKMPCWFDTHSESSVKPTKKMPTEENQLAWLRLGVGYIGPLTIQDHHRQTLHELLEEAQTWEELPYVAQREMDKDERTIYRGLGHTVTLKDLETGIEHPVRHLYVHSSALSKREAKRRQDEIATIEAEIKRIQGLVNKYDYKTPEIITRRVQQKAFKKRPAQRYFDVKVIEHADRPEAPLELRYIVNYEQATRDAELDGVYLLVAGGRQFVARVEEPV